MTPWPVSTLQSLGALQGYMYPDDGYAMQSSGLSVIRAYETNSIFGIPSAWSTLAPSGQYLARLEHAREAVKEEPKYEHGSLTSVLADLRRTFERNIQLAEIKTLADLRGRGPNYTVEVLSNLTPSLLGVNLPFQLETIDGYPIAASVLPSTVDGLTAGV